MRPMFHITTGVYFERLLKRIIDVGLELYVM
jgi:hypothetical protein